MNKRDKLELLKAQQEYRSALLDLVDIRLKRMEIGILGYGIHHQITVLNQSTKELRSEISKIVADYNKREKHRYSDWLESEG